MDNLFYNNKVQISGMIVSGFEYSHEVCGEKFYQSTVEVRRLSGQSDYINIIISERLVDIESDFIGVLVRISGQYRSYNKKDDIGNHLILSVFVRELEILTELPSGEECNQIFLDGYICKTPVYRKTPLGREIADLLIAVNRSYGKSDYIPCICWGRNTRYVTRLESGTHVEVSGRIQSRDYKKIVEDVLETRTAYEVSISKIELLEG